MVGVRGFTRFEYDTLLDKEYYNYLRKLHFVELISTGIFLIGKVYWSK